MPARFIAEEPCPRRHHHRSTLPSATWFSWRAALLESSRAYWGCWPGAADPRHRWRLRHRLAGILGLALCAIAPGARSFTAIAELATDADEQTLRMLRITGVLPAESTFRRTLQRLDAGAFDDLAGSWAAQRTAPGPGSRRVIAVDGKTLRGSASGGEPGEHLLAALDQAQGAVLCQVEVGAKTNEIPMFPVLMERIGVTSAVITADALYPQRDHAEHQCRARGGLPVHCRAKPAAPVRPARVLPWQQVPVAHEFRERGHGREERRVMKVTAVAAGLVFPYAAQAIQIVRSRKLPGKKNWSRETVFAVTSLTATQVRPAELAAIIRGQWRIEDCLHWSATWTTTKTVPRSALPAAHG